LSVLDLFSGTGNIAYEFGSRGANRIVAVDAHYACAKFISHTAKELDLPIEAIKSDCFQFLKRTAEKFDLIFADPPYDMSDDLFKKIVQLVFEKDLLTDKGLLIIEHSKQTTLEDSSNFIEERKYGGSVFSFFEKQ
jgi:16S rRNA (guanine(966)-N(2))-methyltransferase RsmD